jgi:23S rRNA (uridine2552-2'-O)-methyltransferase
VQQDHILAGLGGRADVLLSDMAPKLSGIKEVDEARSMELCRLALASTKTLLRPGGVLLLKVFMGQEHKAFLAGIRTFFSSVRTTKPEASRKSSAETYVFAAALKKG